MVIGRCGQNGVDALSLVVVEPKREKDPVQTQFHGMAGMIALAKAMK